MKSSIKLCFILQEVNGAQEKGEVSKYNYHVRFKGEVSGEVMFLPLGKVGYCNHNVCLSSSSSVKFSR